MANASLELHIVSLAFRTLWKTLVCYVSLGIATWSSLAHRRAISQHVGSAGLAVRDRPALMRFLYMPARPIPQARRWYTPVSLKRTVGTPRHPSTWSALVAGGCPAKPGTPRPGQARPDRASHVSESASARPDRAKHPETTEQNQGFL